MLFLGHIGASVALVKATEHIMHIGKKADPAVKAKVFDYRFVVIGAVLPDLIDKPLVQLLYGLQQHSGHFFAHTASFSMLLILIGAIVFVARRSSSMLLLGICSMLHYLMDILILGPNVTLYKIFNGLFFLVPKDFGVIDHIASPVFHVFPYFKAARGYLLQPYIYIFEVIGFFILAAFFVRLPMKKRVKAFFRSGSL